MTHPDAFEQLGVFYLGKEYDFGAGELKDELLLYDSKDLTTHAVCVGMTGSGKTGLCISLLEEAAIDGIPAIAIDPKGDLGNLLLTFPKLEPQQFEPWIDPDAAARKGKTVEEFAQDTAQMWKNGLANWGQDGQRIGRLREAADVAIYTPGSSAGLPVTVLKSFDAPPAELRRAGDEFRERVSSTASGVLALLGIDADPIRSREHILLSNILSHCWQEGQSLDLPRLIQFVQAPPMERVGVFELDSFFPADDRLELAMQLNNLLASPSFAGWSQGEALNIQRLMYTPEGRPRISIMSIAHLSDSERMFFVTILLNEILAWMRSQPGTTSLRALLYMDEIFGFFPPTANPPSKEPMLTLLKQARAFGLGCVLATQNPVDLDYKGLSNAGTWFLGRLQTERDKARVLDGLEGASAAAGATFDRRKMEATLAGLGSRVFLMNNVHEDRPVVFHTRWALSYLRGPLSRAQITELMADRKETAPEGTATPQPGSSRDDMFADLAPAAGGASTVGQSGTAKAGKKTGSKTESQQLDSQKPPVPREIKEVFARIQTPGRENESLVYRAGLFAEAKLHFVLISYGVDQWRDVTVVEPFTKGELPEVLWENALVFAADIPFDKKPRKGASFSPVPKKALRASSYRTFGSKLKSRLYQTEKVVVLRSKSPKITSAPDEAADQFRVKLTQQLREDRDRALEKLRQKQGDKVASLQARIAKAEERLDREKDQYSQKKVDTAVSFGQSILGALLGRKLASRTNVSRAATSARSASRAARERSDIQRAEDALEDAQEKLTETQKEFEKELAELHKEFNPDQVDIEERIIKPRKTDIAIDRIGIVWLPWWIDDEGTARIGW